MSGYIGKDIARLEDRRFVTGTASYIADLRLPGMVDVAFVRSIRAHGRITRVDASEALIADGVVAVLTAADLAGLTKPFTRQFYSAIDPVLVSNYNLTIHPYHAPVLAGDRVMRVGEAIAMVLARDRYLAEDASELVAVDIDPMAALSDPYEALSPSAPRLHDDVPGNVHSEFTVKVGDPRGALAAADRRLAKRFRIRRSVGCPIETRGVVAKYEKASGDLTVWSNTQTPHVLRGYLSEMLDIREDAIRVIRPDMGGSFGGGVADAPGRHIAPVGQAAKSVKGIAAGKDHGIEAEAAEIGGQGQDLQNRRNNRLMTQSLDGPRRIVRTGLRSRDPYNRFIHYFLPPRLRGLAPAKV